MERHTVEVEGRRRVQTGGRRIDHAGARYTVGDYVMEGERRSRVEGYEAEERRIGPEGHRKVVEADTGYGMVHRMGVAVVADSRAAAAEEGNHPVVVEEGIDLAADILVAGRMAEDHRSPAVAVDSPEADIGLAEAGRSPLCGLSILPKYSQASVSILRC